MAITAPAIHADLIKAFRTFHFLLIARLARKPLFRQGLAR